MDKKIIQWDCGLNGFSNVIYVFGDITVELPMSFQHYPFDFNYPDSCLLMNYHQICMCKFFNNFKHHIINPNCDKINIDAANFIGKILKQIYLFNNNDIVLFANLWK